MEVGAVKQAYNNEIIMLKKKLGQAKIQIIHKLTRKAKTLTEKKAPEPLTEKLKRKAESAVKEVLIIKKLKARDIGKFIITHKGQLQGYLNQPQVDFDKACARLLLHKVMQDKYKLIRNRFSNVSIDDLLMNRQERKKLKEQAKEMQNNKKKAKTGKVVNAEGEWDVEDVRSVERNKLSDSITSAGKESGEEVISEPLDDEIKGDESESDSESVGFKVSFDEQSDEESENDCKDNAKNIFATSPIEKQDRPLVKMPPINNFEVKPSQNKPKKKKKHNNDGKNKNFNEKIQQRKFKKHNIDDAFNTETKVVDSFFKTSTGESYMSVADVRPPDEVKEEHKQGNRKLRRAVMFGHRIPKRKPRNEFSDNSYNRQNSFDNRTNKFDKQDKKFENHVFNRNGQFHINKKDDNQNNFYGGKDSSRRYEEDSKTEKLHPSWEAKKKQSGILPFQGKKITFE